MDFFQKLRIFLKTRARELSINQKTKSTIMFYLGDTTSYLEIVVSGQDFQSQDSELVEG